MEFRSLKDRLEHSGFKYGVYSHQTQKLSKPKTESLLCLSLRKQSRHSVNWKLLLFTHRDCGVSDPSTVQVLGISHLSCLPISRVTSPGMDSYKGIAIVELRNGRREGMSRRLITFFSGSLGHGCFATAWQMPMRQPVRNEITLYLF